MNVLVVLYFGFDISCTMSGVTIAYNHHLVVLSVRRLTNLRLCSVALAYAGLSTDYDWNGFGVKELCLLINFVTWLSPFARALLILRALL